VNIKDKIKINGIYQWEVAEKLNVSEFTLSRWLRRPENMCNSKRQSIEKAINEIKISQE
jgi:transposase